MTTRKLLISLGILAAGAGTLAVLYGDILLAIAFSNSIVEPNEPNESLPYLLGLFAFIVLVVIQGIVAWAIYGVFVPYTDDDELDNTFPPHRNDLKLDDLEDDE